MHFLKIFVWLGLLVLIPAASFAAAPTWWTDSGNGTAFIDGNSTVNNYAPLNLGQLKNVATKAKIYLDAQLSLVGGAGPGVDNLVSNFTHTSTDYAPVNLGQLKAVAKPFYDRIIGLGYNTTANLITQGYAGNYTGVYPWSTSTNTTLNYAPANLGQLKMVFSFSLSTLHLSVSLDTDGDGLPDWWETANGLNPSSSTGNDGAAGDPDGDGSSNLQEYLNHTNPNAADNAALGFVVYTILE